ncbi:hypothetical protein [Micromonospora sp. RP3T]|uniref:hypothetical protein n=1 Tax=Micromonospora sp. RP3T TaxID=2135446 RepID=UPI003D70D4BA
MTTRVTPRPGLDGWAEVDPARHPFDPAVAAGVVRRLAPPPPPPAPDMPSLEPYDATAWSAYQEAGRRSVEWNMAMTDALVAHYGTWAYDWAWPPTPVWDRWTPIVTSSEETLRLVAASLVAWRRWVEETAGRLHRLLPSLRAAALIGPDDAVVAWEAAIAELLTAAVAWAEETDDWFGRGRRLLTWLLTAAGLPVEHSVTLVGRALDARFHGWVHLTAADVADVAEHLAREVIGRSAGRLARPGECGDDWPDTWPHGWPSWRAANRPRPYS